MNATVYRRIRRAYGSVMLICSISPSLIISLSSALNTFSSSSFLSFSADLFGFEIFLNRSGDCNFCWWMLLRWILWEEVTIFLDWELVGLFSLKKSALRSLRDELLQEDNYFFLAFMLCLGLRFLGERIIKILWEKVKLGCHKIKKKLKCSQIFIVLFAQFHIS